MTKAPPAPELLPRDVSDGLKAKLQQIDDAIRDADRQISKIANRGFMDNLVSSDREDLLAVSTSQNRINSLMMAMINQVVMLNAMSYAFLVSVVDDLARSVKDGWTDSEGRFHQLSDTGRTFADDAIVIFNSIISGARSTQEAIERNAAGLVTAQARIVELARLDQEQAHGMRGLEDQLQEMRLKLTRAGVEAHEREAGLRRRFASLSIGLGLCSAGVIGLGLKVFGA